MPRDDYDRDDDDRRRYNDDDDRPRRRRRRADDDFDTPPKKGMSGAVIALIVVGIVLGVLFVCGGLLVALLLPAVQKVRDASVRMQSSNNGKQLGIAFHAYFDANGKMPGPFVDQGLAFGEAPPVNPADRLSWRVEMLPYLEQDYLYRGIQRDQAWNSVANRQYTSTPVMPFGDPKDPTDENTRFRCFYDNGALFSTDPNQRVGISGIKDGASNTVMFAESAERVPWAQFNEWKFTPSVSPPPLGHPERDTFLVGMADGSVRFIKKDVSPTLLNAAITRAGAEVSILE